MLQMQYKKPQSVGLFAAKGTLLHLNFNIYAVWQAKVSQAIDSLCTMIVNFD
jgi:hypothetical protein